MALNMRVLTAILIVVSLGLAQAQELATQNQKKEIKKISSSLSLARRSANARKNGPQPALEAADSAAIPAPASAAGVDAAAAPVDDSARPDVGVSQAQPTGESSMPSGRPHAGPCSGSHPPAATTPTRITAP